MLLDKNLTGFIRDAYKHYIIPVLSNSVKNSMWDGLPKICNFQAIINTLISHINFSMYTILVFLRTYFPYVSSVMNNFNFILG